LDAAEPDAVFRELSDQLRAEVVDAVPGWVRREVRRIHEAWSGGVPDEVGAAAERAGKEAAAVADAELEVVLAGDVDEQRTNPLAVLRGLVRFPTAVLNGAGVPPVVRDEFAESRFPADAYDLTPAGFGDVDPALHEMGIAWGAAKAMAHRRRHR
jgi:hypothetical protein